VNTELKIMWEEAGGSVKNTKYINVMMEVVGSSEMSINLHNTVSGP
jgi:hypothetical protein